MMKRRKFTAVMKARTVLALVSGEKTSAELCREHEIKPQLLYQWREQFVASAHLVYEQPQSTDKEDERIAELERKVGRLTMELDVAKKPRRSQVRTKTGNSHVTERGVSRASRVRGAGLPAEQLLPLSQAGANYAYTQ